MQACCSSAVSPNAAVPALSARPTASIICFLIAPRFDCCSAIIRPRGRSGPTDIMTESGPDCQDFTRQEPRTAQIEVGLLFSVLRFGRQAGGATRHGDTVERHALDAAAGELRPLRGEHACIH